VLFALVEIYEAKRWPIEIGGTFDPIDVLRFAIDELGHTQAELAELLGSRSRASEVLSRRRALTVEMIHKVSEAWKIPADLLVRPHKTARPGPPAIIVERLRVVGYRVDRRSVLWRRVARHSTPGYDVAAHRPRSCEIALRHDSNDDGLELGTEYQYI
jgi:HTH-type transcriptional regulator / antitoxin HigA